MPEPSPATETALAAMQRGMLGRILGETLGSPTVDAMPAIRTRDTGPSPGERLGVYARGYAERLRACLAADFPALRGFVGDQVFDLFAHGYIAQCPSRSRSLYDLGAGFADYLEAHRPADDADPLDGLPGELARLERARTEVGRAPGLEGAGAADVAGLLLVLPQARLAMPATTRLVRSGFALKDVLEAVDRGERPPVPPARPTFLAVARMHYRVAVHELSAGQFALLEGCAGGATLAAALAAAGAAATADLPAWVPRAIDAGLLTA